jgi:hypothetical protein
MSLCLLLAFHIYGCPIGSITSTKVTIGIVCHLCFSKKKLFFDVNARYFLSVFTQHLLQQPIHNSGHPTLKTLHVLSALDKSWLPFALGCPGIVMVALVAALLF